MSQAHQPTFSEDRKEELRDAFETIAEKVDDEEIAEQWGYRPLRRLEKLTDDEN